MVMPHAVYIGHGNVMRKFRCQLRADGQQEKIVPPEPIQQAKHELERSDAEATVMPSGGDGSEQG